RGYSMEDAQDLTQDFFLKILEPAFASGLSSPFDLAFDSAGNLFVTDWGSGGHIYKFTPDGTQSTFAQLVAPEGLAFDSAGNLFVVDEDTGNIFKFTPDGVRSTFAKAVGFSMDEVAFLAFSPTPGPIPAAVRRHRHRHHHHLFQFPPSFDPVIGAGKWDY